MPAPLPSAHESRTAVSPLRVLSELPRKCPFRRRACTLAARVRACESLVTFRVTVQVLWKVCAHCGTAGVPFVARARRGHACSTPLEYPCPVPSRTKTQCGHRVLCWCECVARTGAYAFHCTAGTNQARRRDVYSNKLDGTIPVALSALKLLSYLCARRARDAAPCACVRAPARWCPYAPLRAPARTVALPCACPRRTWP